MARSFSTAKNFSLSITNEISVMVTRRRFSAAAISESTAGVSSRIAQKVMLKKGSEETEKSSWAPDPVTGYYRPENYTEEIDAAELRAMLLKHKTAVAQQ